MMPPFSSVTLETPFLCQTTSSSVQNGSTGSLSALLPDSPNSVCSVSNTLPALNQEDNRTYAYVTLLTRDSYLMGVQCLYRSLQAVDSKHPLIVIYTPDTLSSEAAATLKTEGCVMRPVKAYFPPEAAAVDHSLYKNQCYADCWTKLLMWEMEEYDVLAYLDADMLVAKNIDHLFQLPTEHRHHQQQSHNQRKTFPHSSVSPVIWAVPDCAAGRPTEEERSQCSLLHHNIKKLKINSENNQENLNTTTNQQRCCYSYFNAGMFIFTPSIAQLEDFNQALRSGRCPIQGYAEQDFLNHYFRESWQPLSTNFNLQKGIRSHHPELWFPEEAFIIHYTDCKPWHGRDHPENEEYIDIVNWWWDIYNCGGKQEKIFE